MIMGERKTPAGRRGSIMYLPIFQEKAGVKAFFTTRRAAPEGTPFDSGSFWELAEAGGRVAVRPEQVHESRVEILRKQDLRRAQPAADFSTPADQQGAESRPPLQLRLPATDGVATDCSRFLLTTVHADCLPVYLYAQRARAVALVHAGWRGARAGIAPKAVRLLQEAFGAGPDEIAAAIGPGIGRCCFEVGPEVRQAFLEQWAFTDEFAVPVEPGNLRGKFMMDLKGINRRQLESAGVKDIWVSELCTCCRPDLFHSYRRQQGTKARMVAGICLE
ncbi:MAG: peptidoglycan editing factor PgeF [Bacillota bacterium]|nr:peptidoglycan editing factor PgeF [Bacillota bacterium]